MGLCGVRNITLKKKKKKRNITLSSHFGERHIRIEAQGLEDTAGSYSGLRTTAAGLQVLNWNSWWCCFNSLGVEVRHTGLFQSWGLVNNPTYNQGIKVIMNCFCFVCLFLFVVFCFLGWGRWFCGHFLVSSALETMPNQ